MITSKSNFFKGAVAVLAAMPIAAAATLTPAGSAQAAALVGEFSFNGGFTAPGGSSLVHLKKDSLFFTPDSIGVGSTGFLSSPISLASQDGTFVNFNSASIRDVISFGASSFQNPFLDLGNLVIPGIILPGDDVSSLNDNVNTFTLVSSSYELDQSGANLDVEVLLSGFFTSASGEVTKGLGNLTFQRNNTTIAQANTILNAGNSLGNLTFSGAVFTTAVPEPATLLGLGVVAAGMAVSRRRKTIPQ